MLTQKNMNLLIYNIGIDKINKIIIFLLL